VQSVIEISGRPERTLQYVELRYAQYDIQDGHTDTINRMIRITMTQFQVLCHVLSINFILIFQCDIMLCSFDQIIRHHVPYDFLLYTPEVQKLSSTRCSKICGKE